MVRGLHLVVGCHKLTKLRVVIIILRYTIQTPKTRLVICKPDDQIKDHLVGRIAKINNDKISYIE